MKKRVYLIHGWNGRPDKEWFPWLKEVLETQGFEVTAPLMPTPEAPVKVQWVKFLENLVPNPDENTFFVCHSMGCRALFQYLENLPDGVRIGGAVLVAGWVTLPKWDGRTDEETEIVKNWTSEQARIDEIKKHCGKFVAIFSDDDEYVPQENWKVYEQQLGAEVIILKKRGHFSKDEDTIAVPEALDALIKIAQ